MNSKILRRLGLTVLVCILMGCASIWSSVQINLPHHVPAQTLIKSVPFFAQAKHQCGPAALAMVLQWSGVDVTPKQLVSFVYLPVKRGSLQWGLISAARRHGRLAYVFTGMADLIQEVAAGNPVVVLQNLGLRWLPKWHYAVVVGYNTDTNCMVLHTGTKAFRQIGVKTFLNTWQRADQWALCVLKPGAIPASADEHRYLEAAYGLEQAKQNSPALKAFQAATTHWPSSVQVHLAFGNLLYTNGIFSQAIQSYLKALDIDSDNGVALNNLAHLLSTSGKFKEAEKMARRAVAIGGRYKDVYDRTLREILLKQDEWGYYPKN